MPNAPLNKIILALDNFNDREEIWSFMQRRGKYFSHVKLGLEFFCRYGAEGIKEFQSQFECPLFLDLKLHDIPNTVARAIRSLQGLSVEFLTIHLSGGEAMVSQAIEQARLSLPHCKVLGVSYLTSLGENDFKQLWDVDVEQTEHHFKRLFDMALNTRIEGVVLSGKELAWVRQSEEQKKGRLIKVTPGIRFKASASQDQQRVLTPQEAVAQGADFLVMGRDWTQVDDAKFQAQIQQCRQWNL